jgi:serine/threonine-protein kinase
MLDPASPSEERDQELAILLTSIADRVAAGEAIDTAEVCREHPEFAEDLRDLMGTMIVTQAAGESPSDPGTETRYAALELPHEMENFVLEEEIGRGGMGIVYRAYRKSDGRAVAVKMLLKGEFASEIEKQRFDAEASAAMRLKHRNIIPIYELGEHKGRAFFVMKYIEGETLTQRLSRGPMTAPETARLMSRISEAMGYAHEQGVLHRDLKPSNVMLDTNNEPYIADFGLAKQTSNDPTITRSGAILGTPSYMAPEQAAGRRGQVGVTSDVYSLGAILYHMLTGRPPFQAATPVDTVLLVLEQDPLPPRALNQRVNRDLEMIALRCLQKPQDLRYDSANKMAEDLTRFLNDESVSAREGRLMKVLSNVFRETHHASVLENWGLLWIWHSVVLLIACVGTNLMYWAGVTDRTVFSVIWSVGFGAWGVVFWLYRRQMGPVTFIERQIAHVWGASLMCVFLLFPFEGYLELELFRLAPVMCMVAAMVFLIKGGCLSGSFYIQTMALFLTAFVMGMFPDFALLLFGIVSFGCFFFPGVKYHRQRLKNSVADRLI